MTARAIARRPPRRGRPQPVPGEPFSNHTPREPVPIAGEIDLHDRAGVAQPRSQPRSPRPTPTSRSRAARPTATRSRIPFHVTSADWQESDRLLAGILTAFGARTGAIPIGGYGTFDGVMLNEFRRPRIEGTFAGEQMRAWDVDWGSAKGSAVIENSYVDVKDVADHVAAQSAISVDGRFSAGLPAPRRRRGDQRAHPRDQPAGGGPAPRVRHRRLRRGRHAVGRVPRLRPVPAAARASATCR